MFNNEKPGGGNKPQPYIPAGHGSKSGEYTNKPLSPNDINCNIKNEGRKYNFKNSLLVRKVNICVSIGKGGKIGNEYKPNSVIKKVIDGFVVSERYFNQEGKAYLDIDYTCHGNPYTHPVVPHIHRWWYINGKFIRGEMEDFI